MPLAYPLDRAASESHVPDGYLRIGVLTRPHGLHGALRLRLDNAGATVLSPGMRVFIPGESGPDEYELLSIGPLGRGLFRITLAQVAEIGQAEALSGRVLMIASNDLPPAAAG
ncbi:MAG: hypothetical protein ACREP6_08785, partial [Candidatus Binataceae bacterium]